MNSSARHYPTGALESRDSCAGGFARISINDPADLTARAHSLSRGRAKCVFASREAFATSGYHETHYGHGESARMSLQT